MYCLPDDYKENKQSTQYLDAGAEDEYQNEVYSYAKNIFESNNFRSVVDFGCGSGFKLIKFFDNYNTIGLEIEPTLSFLKQKYPDRLWYQSEFNNAIDTDLLICSDVIEHLDNPELLISFIKKSNWKKCILSTPDRDSVQKMHFGKLFNGPPSNKAHIREWNKEEFYNFISEHFDVSEHFLCKAHKKHTLKVCQVILLER